MNFIWLRKVVFLCGRNKTFRQRDTRVQSAVFFPRHHVTLLYPIISYMRKKVANNFIRRFLTFLFFLALKDVSKQLWSTLHDFPELQLCEVNRIHGWMRSLVMDAGSPSSTNEHWIRSHRVLRETSWTVHDVWHDVSWNKVSRVAGFDRLESRCCAL